MTVKRLDITGGNTAARDIGVIGSVFESESSWRRNVSRLIGSPKTSSWWEDRADNLNVLEARLDARGDCLRHARSRTEDSI
jgi:hypothetical protein